jgi:hypothetical protein
MSFRVRFIESHREGARNVIIGHFAITTSSRGQCRRLVSHRARSQRSETAGCL